MEVIVVIQEEAVEANRYEVSDWLAMPHGSVGLVNTANEMLN